MVDGIGDLADGSAPDDRSIGDLTDGFDPVDSADASPKSVAERIHDLEAVRKAAWATTFNRSTAGINNEWDFVFDGKDSAADGVPNHLRYDSPIDDDWAFPQFGFKLNTPVVGVMTVDRLTVPIGDGYFWQKTGNIWRRDPALSAATGVTIELYVKLYSAAEGISGEWNQADDAFSITYQDELGSLGVHLSAHQNGIPWGIKAGSLDPATVRSNWQTKIFNTTSGTYYRLWKAANTMAFSFQVGQLGGAEIMQATGDVGVYAAKHDGSYYSYPRVLIGDNSNEAPHRLADGSKCDLSTYIAGQCAGGKNARYELDWLYVRRGAVPQGQTGVPLSVRTPPPLPPFSPGKMVEFASGLGFFPGAAVVPADDTVAPPFQATGTLHLDPATGLLELSSSDPARRRASNIRVGYLYDYAMGSYAGKVTGLSSHGPWTIELRAKILPDSDAGGCAVEMIDGVGMGAFALSPSQVQVLLGTSPQGAAPPINRTTTDAIHTYRLVRPCSAPGADDCLYTYFYIDDDPVPQVADQHVGGTIFGSLATDDFSRLSFGALGYPSPGAQCHVLVESLRWAPSAWAPPNL